VRKRGLSSRFVGRCPEHRGHMTQPARFENSALRARRPLHAWRYLFLSAELLVHTMPSLVPRRSHCDYGEMHWRAGLDEIVQRSFQSAPRTWGDIEFVSVSLTAVTFGSAKCRTNPRRSWRPNFAYMLCKWEVAVPTLIFNRRAASLKFSPSARSLPTSVSRGESESLGKR
jgi:hypothetical protein